MLRVNIAGRHRWRKGERTSEERHTKEDVKLLREGSDSRFKGFETDGPD